MIKKKRKGGRKLRNNTPQLEEKVNKLEGYAIW
jgi:hypothetical protein